MNEDLRSLAGDERKESTAENTGSGFDFSAFVERFNSFDEKLDRVIEMLSKDVQIDESNNDKVSITEAEGKINENEEYREAEEEREDKD